MIKKVFVTGGLGFIGSNLIDLLIKSNYFVIKLIMLPIHLIFITLRILKRIINLLNVTLIIKKKFFYY